MREERIIMNYASAIENLKEVIANDYYLFSARSSYCESEEWAEERGKTFLSQLSVSKGRKYDKLIRTDNQRTVWGFVVKEDNAKFKKGDILMAASWSAPATNKARGNIFEESVNDVKWTGPGYLF
jgi:O-glycosyl hydrolase